MVVQPSASLQVVPSLPMNQGGGEIALQQEAEDVGEKFKRYAYNFTNVQLRSKTVIHCTKHYNSCNAL